MILAYKIKQSTSYIQHKTCRRAVIYNYLTLFLYYFICVQTSALSLLTSKNHRRVFYSEIQGFEPIPHNHHE